MAIPTPTIPSAVNPVSAVRLTPTTNNQAFFINSGLINATNTETTVVSVNDVGKRDIIFWINPILTSASADEMTMKVKNNGSLIYQTIFNEQQAPNSNHTICFIIPANTSIEITFTNQDSSTHPVGVSCYGYYMRQ